MYDFFSVLLKLATKKGKIAQLSLPDVYTSKRTSSFDPDCFSKKEKDEEGPSRKTVHVYTVQASDSGIMYKSQTEGLRRQRGHFLLTSFCALPIIGQLGC